MNNALSVFQAAIAKARELRVLYLFLQQTAKIPESFDDLLRAQLVYSVGAFDKLIHDIVRRGMVQTFVGQRPATDKYRSEPISLELHDTLTAATVPPPEFIFEQEVAKKLSKYSFQEPGKVAEGLALVWDESYKWQKISAQMQMPESDVKTRMKLIVTRRNAIVHESDMHPLTNAQNAIGEAEVADITNFIESCGKAIVGLVA